VTINRSRDLTKAKSKLTAEGRIDDTAVRVRTRFDLYANLPALQPVARPTNVSRSNRAVVTGGGADALVFDSDLVSQSSKAIVRGGDLVFGDSDNAAQQDLVGERALIAGLTGTLSWTRNPPSIADKFSITLRGDSLPVDLRIFDSLQVFGWMFVHEDHGEPLRKRMMRLKPGDPGSFGGVVDTIERNDEEQTIELGCRDFTALLLAHDAHPKLLKSIDLNTSIESVVSRLVLAVPGGQSWVVTTRGNLAGRQTLAKLLAEERTVKKRSKSSKVLRPKEAARAAGALIGSAGASGIGLGVYQVADLAKKSIGKSIDPATGKFVRSVRPGALPTVPVVGGGVASAGAAIGATLQAQEEAKRTSLGGEPVAKYVTTRKRKNFDATPDRVFGSKRQSIWDAISKATQLSGVIAEVGISHTGKPMVVLIDALEIHKGTVFRPFERGKRRHRVMTHGADMAQLVERRHLIGGRRINWVEVYSTDPITGKTFREKYSDGPPSVSIAPGLSVIETGKRGKKAKKKISNNGVTVFAHGAHSAYQLQKIAKRIYAQINRGELEISFSTLLPWTTGGNPFEADLLSCASGALIEIQFARADRFKGLELERALKLLGVPPKAAKKFAKTSQLLRPTVLFQVAEIVHTVGEEGEYRADVIAQTLLDDINVPEGESLESV
jgi:hypothetical protein